MPFQNKDIEIEENDIFYLFSDGFIDQFGGENGKKYRSRRFKHLLLEIHKKPLEIQKKTLHHHAVQVRCVEQLVLPQFMNSVFDIYGCDSGW